MFCFKLVDSFRLHRKKLVEKSNNDNQFWKFHFTNKLVALVFSFLSWTKCFLFKSLHTLEISLSVPILGKDGHSLQQVTEPLFIYFYLKSKTLSLWILFSWKYRRGGVSKAISQIRDNFLAPCNFNFYPQIYSVNRQINLSNTKFVAPLKYKICNKQNTNRQCRRLQIVTNFLHTKILKWKGEVHPSTFTLLLFESITKSN